MAKNRNKKKRSGVAPMDTTEPTLTDIPQSMDTSDSVATTATHFPASGAPIKRRLYKRERGIFIPGFLGINDENCCRLCLSPVHLSLKPRNGNYTRFMAEILCRNCEFNISIPDPGKPRVIVNLFHNRKKGVTMKRSKNVRKIKAIAKAVSQNAKSMEKFRRMRVKQ
ncbi:hypothetical protein CK203_074793 [Vitis vinifera]|uniref:Uncharacterized protein n=1 Tax=Vitis vinifera TaxID=29760 RepID=A0A438DM34_VITVI|nr:hypothetical protein CK203_074793 [Vitis vinifera]